MVSAVEGNSCEAFTNDILSEVEKGLDRVEKSDEYIPGSSFIGMPKTTINRVQLIFFRLKEEGKFNKTTLTKPVDRAYSREKAIEVIREEVLKYSSLSKESSSKNFPLQRCIIKLQISNPGLFTDTLSTFNVADVKLNEYDRGN